jgi:hypothetical protein
MQAESRRPLAPALFIGGIVFGALIWRISPFYGESIDSRLALVHAVLVPVLPFWILAAAALVRRKDGRWWCAARYLQGLAIAVAVMVLAPNLWWFIEVGGGRYSGGGVNFAIAFGLLFLPVVLPFVLILGLGLAAESSRTRS